MGVRGLCSFLKLNIKIKNFVRNFNIILYSSSSLLKEGAVFLVENTIVFLCLFFLFFGY